MATEASKTRQIWSQDTLSLLRGEGIDIGCGPDPILPSVQRFDQAQGDANHVSRFVNKKYDFVFSSHTLEHMHDPSAALRDWYSIVKPGGHMVILVPDEDLYEQGTFPSLFNSDHKHTFTISKSVSWSPKSVNVLNLANSLGGEVLSVELQDHGYDRSLLNFGAGKIARRLGKMAMKLVRHYPNHERAIYRWFRRIGAVIDQTDMREPRLAQIQFIVRKPT